MSSSKGSATEYLLRQKAGLSFLPFSQNNSALLGTEVRMKNMIIIGTLIYVVLLILTMIV